VVGSAARLLARHWPALLALALGARAGRWVVMMVAVRASEINGVLGGLIFVLVPIVTLTALVIMLRLLARSLPGLDEPPPTAAADPAAAPASSTGPPRRLVDYTGSVLVPFLAIYASYGHLKKDGTEYLRRIFDDEVMANADLFTNPGKIDVASRMPFTVGYTLVATVIVAVVLRWLLSRWEGGRRRTWPAMLGAYVEVTWITLVVRQAMLLKRLATEWIEQRRVIRWAAETWSGAVEALTRKQPNGALKSVLSSIGDTFSSADMIFVLPLAWLAVGAVVYGRALAPLPPPTHRLYQRAAEKLAARPGAVGKLTTAVGKDLYNRFAPLLQGLRRLLRAGWSSMLSFWLAFLIAQSAPQWLWELERLLIGPRDLGLVWMPLSAPVGVLNEAVGTVLLVCLLAAAIDRTLNVADSQPPVSRA